MAFSFGAPAATAAPTFGAPAPAAGGFSFGAATAAPAGGGLFGSTPAPAPGAFGAAPAFGAPKPAGGLFGAPAPAPGGLFGSAPAPAGGLFGATPAPAAAGFGAPAGGGLFGAAPKPAGGLFGAPAPAPGGLFGSTPAPAPGGFSLGGAAPAGGGLFGAKPAGGGLFGAPAPAAGGLFGSTPAPAPGGGLFGSSPTSTSFGAPAAGGLFGATPAPAYGAPSAAGGLFGGAAGGGLFGQQPAYGQPQQMVAAPATQPATRFEQLPATPATLGRDGVLAVEKHLAQNRTLQKRVALAAQPVREGMAHLREAVAAARGALERAEHEQRRAATVGGGLRLEAAALRRDGEELAARASSRSAGDSLRLARELPAPLLWRHLANMEKRLAAYARDVTTVRPARRDGARADDDSANCQLARVLAAQRDAFLRVADDVARMHARVDDARRGVRRRDPGLDPFADADREEKAAARELDAEIRLGAQRAAAAAPAAVPGVAAPAGGLFGAATPAPAGGLFGSAPAPGGSLFGATAAPPAPALTRTATPATGLFGAPAAAAPAGGLFGAPAAAAPVTTLSAKKPSRNRKKGR